ncbi:TonB-dependent receptor domain-containing protein [uncultured Selenomonas sp.]|uniref:TonB-dependent receptor n=1 Tax=uncultured Selenomonas sp. TaxID=159275 RepID=UPI0028EBDD57|nr:TonB-dependent receptor [uncultured Selenomonas sp.]
MIRQQASISRQAVQYESRPNDIWQYDVKYYHIIDENDLWVRNLLNTEGGSLPRFTHRAPQWYRSGWFSRGNGVEANASVAYDSKNVLSFGAKYIKLSWNTDENNTSYRHDGNDARRSFYVENAWSADNRTWLTIGVRRKDVTQDFRDNDTATQKTTSKSNAFDPVLNFTHDITKHNTIRLSAGRSHVFVGSKDAAGNIRSGYPVPKPERNSSYELGWKHKFGTKAEFDLTHFRTEVRDRITMVRYGRDRVLENVDKTHIRGLELSYRQTFSPKLFGFANYTWINAKDESAGMTTIASGLPTQIFNLGVTYREGKLRSTLLGRAMRARLDSSGEPTSAGYFAADLDLRYEPQADLGIFLRVNNLFDTDYQYRWGNPADGTNFLLGVDMTF